LHFYLFWIPSIGGQFLRDADVLSIADMTRAQIEAVQRVASRMRDHVEANGEINLVRWELTHF
jgi:hypothetical protein